MKNLIRILSAIGVLAGSALGQVIPTPATLAQTNAGTNRTTYISPYTLNQWGGGGGGGGAPTNATFITQTANGTLTNEQALASLATGILKSTTTTGVLSIAAAGDFPTLNQNTTGSAGLNLLLTGGTLSADLTFSDENEGLRFESGATLVGGSNLGINSDQAGGTFNISNGDLSASLSVDGNARIQIQNSNTGTAANAQFRVDTPAGFGLFYQTSAAYTPTGLSIADGTHITASSFTTGGLTLAALGGSATVKIGSANALSLTISGGAAATVTGGAGNMTIAAGTGNSRTMALQSTTSGGTATTFLTGNADQSTTFASGTAPATGAAAGMAFDTNAWAASRGALQIHDGTANTYAIAALASDTPTNGQIPTWNTGGTVTWETVAGTGDVVGPASSTDNAIVRFDSTTGKLLQNSVVTIADTTGDISTPGTITSGTAATATGILTMSGLTSGSLKITGADAMAQDVTISLAAQTSGAATLTIPDLAGVAKTLAWLQSPAFTTPNVGAALGTSLALGSDPADAGVVRLENAAVIGWEASPAGTDATLTVNSSEQFVFSNSILSPTLVTPTLGVATATSINGNTITTGTGVLTIAAAKTLTANASITITGTDATTLTVNQATTLNRQSSTGLPVEFYLACSDLVTTLTTGTSKGYFRAPYAFTVTEVRASVLTPQTSGSLLTVDINDGGTTIISTKITIDNNENTSVTAATPPVISDTAIDDDAIIAVDIDTVGTGAVTGLIVLIKGYR